MERNNTDPISQAKQFAATKEGQELLQLLQNSTNPDLKAAVEKAAAGDYTGAQGALSAFLKDPQARQMLTQFRR